MATEVLEKILQQEPASSHAEKCSFARELSKGEHPTQPRKFGIVLGGLTMPIHAKEHTSGDHRRGAFPPSCEKNYRVRPEAYYSRQN